MSTRFPEKLTTLPDIPKEFGDDGGHFYRYYDELADEIDEDLVRSLKAQLDGILIFAGLFAGVNSAFLALTLPQMTADPADDSNALLLQTAAQPYHCFAVARRGSHYPYNVDMCCIRSVVPIQTTVVAYSTTCDICDRRCCCLARNVCRRDDPFFHSSHHRLYTASDIQFEFARRSGMGGHPDRKHP
ncbi:hypothetical protein M407DRAFT_246487 [Tulasnella calospora MUT 4182]|uniref:DUF6535 domain-containing protein n=1 Tax=Tulasnella calospora MUT 4182 TaxID=1051891 RepID=A0A0C3PU92_9AGAM|nr:hypothetical protein M407DRAFT_246487 [Tulasnella calospora MUT 4182]